MKYLIILLYVIGFFILNENLANCEEIDISGYNQCIEKDTSTSGMIECATEATKFWDKKLNTAYRKLMSLQQTDAQKKSLKDAQLSWIRYRDQTSLLYQVIEEGSLAHLNSATWYMEATKNRADFLESFISSEDDKADVSLTQGRTDSVPEALSVLKKHADGGDAETQYRLGQILYALHNDNYLIWMGKSAKQGHLFARCFLLFDRSGAEHDEWEEQLKEQLPMIAEELQKQTTNSAEAQYYLGRCYMDANSVTQDLVKAVFWFQKAAEQGDTRAQIFLSKCYELGLGVAQDQAKATHWYMKGVSKGISKSKTY